MSRKARPGSAFQSKRVEHRYTPLKRQDRTFKSVGAACDRWLKERGLMGKTD